MKIVIQKFGGTSVATPKAREDVISKVTKLKESGEFPVVVVSAMGRLGAPYATDTLLGFVKETAGEMNPREADLLLSCGEIISAVTLATMLTQKGYPAVALTGGQGGIITTGCYQNADLLYMKPERLMDYIEQGVIPVVAGFQGITAEGDFTTLGRGGSDTTAAMLGMGLKAERIEIFTDVDGMMTADPRVCDKASIIDTISYNEVFQMADSGAKVIHPRAVEYAMRAGIPLVIKNTFSDAEGTVITQNTKGMSETCVDKVISGVAHRIGRTQFTIQDEVAADRDLLGLIAKQAISIDLINIFPDYKVFTIATEDRVKLESVLSEYHYDYTKIEGCCKVTAIGERMTGVPGVMARIVRALTHAKVEILQTADSLTTIGCLIKEEQVREAITALIEEFNL
ncbi:MAG: aspartate kinase [Cellulosilyticaceae bacterium]